MRALLKQLLTLTLMMSLMISLGAVSPVRASAEDNVITKVLTTLSSPPVALMEPSLITAATSTPGCHMISAGWFDASGNPVSGVFSTETYRLEITVGADDGFTIAQDVACYLNNNSINSIVDPSGKTVTLTREYTAEVWAPTVYKNPGAETVDEGGWASFVVSATYVREYHWALVDPSGYTTIMISDLKTAFPDMDSAGDGSTKLKLYHIPYDLDGWKVVCDFVGAGNGNVKRSEPALLTVKPDPSRVIETPVPSSSPTPTPTAEPTPTPEATPTPAPVHQHSFSSEWRYDARSHWHECPEDGAQADLALHTLVWSEVSSPDNPQVVTEQGVCEVCGYTVTRSIGGSAASSENASGMDNIRSSEASENNSSPSGLSVVSRPSLLIALLLALIPLDIILIVFRMRTSRRSTRRHR